MQQCGRNKDSSIVYVNVNTQQVRYEWEAHIEINNSGLDLLSFKTIERYFHLMRANALTAVYDLLCC